MAIIVINLRVYIDSGLDDRLTKVIGCVFWNAELLPKVPSSLLIDSLQTRGGDGIRTCFLV